MQLRLRYDRRDKRPSNNRQTIDLTSDLKKSVYLKKFFKGEILDKDLPLEKKIFIYNSYPHFSAKKKFW